ncbi:hypothetical protein SELMODRAFT_429960 [Selaginella moellendorffii]|uniref:Uncharacterized protein n=1 Tax=Selaginella moellendorffii TaxID=88036 RepID=D8T7W4_SELML|nr:hypothetical protein SELMODRAFT_429960 [Selaginella moellendorffii]
MPHPTWLDFGGFGKGDGSGKMASSQSGKSTLLAAISCRLKELGYLVVLTALNEAMVDAANNKLKDERDAANDFYNAEMCEQSTKNRAQIEKEDWQVNKEQVGRMLAEFARDRNFLFKLEGSQKERHGEDIEQYSKAHVWRAGSANIH